MRKILAITASLLLTGCMSPVEVPVVHHYTLNQIPSVSATETAPLSLMVLPTSAVPGFEAEAMMYSQKPNQVGAFVQNNWAAPPASMFNSLLVTTLQNSHGFKAVISEPATANTDLVLSTKLLLLYQDYSVPKSQEVMVVDANLSTNSGRVLASQQFAITIPANAATPVAGVVAANEAAAELVAQISQFVLSHIPEAQT